MRHRQQLTCAAGAHEAARPVLGVVQDRLGVCLLSAMADGWYLPGMISDRDKAAIATLARRHGAARVWLFGSSASRSRGGRDLDLAVEGLAPARFFHFLGELMLAVSKPVDLVALNKRSKLGALIRKEGVPIYGKPVREG